jgi:hypothetical protein
MRIRHLSIFAVAVMVLLPAIASAAAPRILKWRELVPPAVADAPPKPKPFFAGAAPKDDTAHPQALAEGKFMSMKRRQPGNDRPPALVKELDGQRVSIGGYVVPLDFDSTTVKEFLLVPFVGACIHVPPPPANQIVYVKAEKGFELAETFDPVTVVGTMKTTVAFTGLADAGYTLEAETVERRKE